MDREVERIRRQLSRGGYPLLLRSVSIDGLRGFSETRIPLEFPVMAIAGSNGAGKTTVVKAIASAYSQQREGVPGFFPGKLFMDTPWDSVSGVRFDYAYKHGDDDRNMSVRRPTSRWRGMPGRPQRNVIFLDISRTVPIEALAGYGQVAKRSVIEAEARSTDLDAPYRERLSHVLGRNYAEARFAVPEDDPTKRVGILGQDFGSYSQFHQGAGEATALSLFSILGPTR